MVPSAPMDMMVPVNEPSFPLPPAPKFWGALFNTPATAALASATVLEPTGLASAGVGAKVVVDTTTDTTTASSSLPTWKGAGRRAQMQLVAPRGHEPRIPRIPLPVGLEQWLSHSHNNILRIGSRHRDLPIGVYATTDHTQPHGRGWAGLQYPMEGQVELAHVLKETEGIT